MAECRAILLFWRKMGIAEEFSDGEIWRMCPESRIRGLESRIRGSESRIRESESQIRGSESRIGGPESRIRG